MSEIEHKDSIEELEKVYSSYKKGEYSFGKYETEFDLIQAFLEGKIFVLKGSNKGIYISIFNKKINNIKAYTFLYKVRCSYYGFKISNKEGKHLASLFFLFLYFNYRNSWYGDNFK